MAIPCSLLRSPVLFRPILFPSPPILPVMRFTWSTLTNTIISTVTVLSLIPAANAIYFNFTIPEGGETFNNGTLFKARWNMNTLGSDYSGVLVDVYLMTHSGHMYPRAFNLPIEDRATPLLTYPPTVVPDDDFYISLVVSGNENEFYNSPYFTIESYVG